jgi:hypothetical protein
MRKTILVLSILALLSACKEKSDVGPVEQILDIGIQAEKELAEIAAKQASSQDLALIVELGKQEKAVRDSANARIHRLLGGKGGRLPLALGASSDSIPVVFGHGSIGHPDFHKGEFRINLQIAGVNKRPLPEGTWFQLTALDAQGNALASKEASMVDSAKIGDSLYAGGMFRPVEIKGLFAVSAR